MLGPCAGRLKVLPSVDVTPAMSTLLANVQVPCFCWQPLLTVVHGLRATHPVQASGMALTLLADPASCVHVHCK